MPVLLQHHREVLEVEGWGCAPAQDILPLLGALRGSLVSIDNLRFPPLRVP